MQTRVFCEGKRATLSGKNCSGENLRGNVVDIDGTTGARHLVWGLATREHGRGLAIRWLRLKFWLSRNPKRESIGQRWGHGRSGSHRPSPRGAWPWIVTVATLEIQNRKWGQELAPSGLLPPPEGVRGSPLQFPLSAMTEGFLQSKKISTHLKSDSSNGCGAPRDRHRSTP